MGENSKIEWTDHTFNPWRGCAHAVLPDGSEHPGCAHCFGGSWSAEFFLKDRHDRTDATIVRFGEDGAE